MRIASFDGIAQSFGTYVLWAAFGAIAFWAGCASPGPRGELPFGEWAGQGTLVYEAWASSEDTEEEAKRASVLRSYPTKMSIRPGRIDDREVVEIEIMSERGRLADEDKDAQTHLKLALVKAKRVSDSTVLYRVVAFLYNPGPDAKPTFNEQAPPFSAVCSELWGAKLFQIPYMENFFDNIRFRGRQAEKSGVYFDDDSGIIHWSERLTRRE